MWRHTHAPIARMYMRPQHVMHMHVHAALRALLSPPKRVTRSESHRMGGGGGHGHDTKRRWGHGGGKQEWWGAGGGGDRGIGGQRG